MGRERQLNTVRLCSDLLSRGAPWKNFGWSLRRQLWNSPLACFAIGPLGHVGRTGLEQTIASLPSIYWLNLVSASSPNKVSISVLSVSITGWDYIEYWRAFSVFCSCFAWKFQMTALLLCRIGNFSHINMPGIYFLYFFCNSCLFSLHLLTISSSVIFGCFQIRFLVYWIRILSNKTYQESGSVPCFESTKP